MIYELAIEGDEATSFNFKRPLGGHDKILGPLKKINLIVGPNNYGKSRLLRATTSCRNKKLFTTSEEATQLWYQIESLNVDEAEYASDAERLRQAKSFYSQKPVLSCQLKKTKPYTAAYFNKTVCTERNGIDLAIHFGKLKDAIDKIAHDSDVRDQTQLQCYYIPTLRGFRSHIDETFKNSRTSFFDERTKSDYGSNLNGVDPYTGGTFNEEFKKLLLGPLEGRDLATRYQKFISNEFFDGEPVAILPQLEALFPNIKVGVEKEQPIHLIGEGLQHLITITFCAFQLKSQSNAAPKMLLIEEPELFLHPGLQRKLMNCFLYGFLEGVQVIATTQSNHLLEVALE
jgi:predicted ATP-dependent endonuclease of OLD family